MAVENNDGLRQAGAYMTAIRELRDRYQAADRLLIDAIRDEIRDMVLSVETRSGWIPLGSHPDDHPAGEFLVLLSFGGPSVRIHGDIPLDPDAIRIQGQDWGTAWEDLRIDDADRMVLVWFAQMVGLED